MYLFERPPLPLAPTAVSNFVNTLLDAYKTIQLRNVLADKEAACSSAQNLRAWVKNNLGASGRLRKQELACCTMIRMYLVYIPYSRIEPDIAEFVILQADDTS